MFIYRSKVLLFIFLFSLLCVCGYANPFVVQTIYFEPTDAPPLAEMREKINTYSKQSRTLYADEMERHGFGRKTYKLETDNKGDVIIHHVKGKQNANFYQIGEKTSIRISRELPAHLDVNTPPWDKQDKIRVFIVGGVTLVNNSSWGVGWPYHSGRYGGTCVLAGANANFNQYLIAHEIGHCFGLYHRVNCDTCLMGSGNTTLARYEANWLDKHYHFNDHANRFIYPKLVSDKPRLEVIGETEIRFEIDVRSETGLHQAMIFRRRDIVVIGFDYLNGENKDTIQFRKERHAWDHVTLQVMDTDGDYTMIPISITLPNSIDKIPYDKNPDTIVHNDEEVEKEEDNDEEKDKQFRVKPKDKLTTSWAKLKMQE